MAHINEQKILLKSAEQQAATAKRKVDLLMAKSERIANDLDRLRQELSTLEASVVEKKHQIANKEAALKVLPVELELEKLELSLVVDDVSRISLILDVIPGSEEDDDKILDHVDGVRRRAISAILKYTM
ncbi:hypothetical protein ACP70R_040879 [Stipagrostis hirtigluma subsp. patula]